MSASSKSLKKDLELTVAHSAKSSIVACFLVHSAFLHHGGSDNVLNQTKFKGCELELEACGVRFNYREGSTLIPYSNIKSIHVALCPEKPKLV